jgi:ribonuclease HI
MGVELMGETLSFAIRKAIKS